MLVKKTLSLRSIYEFTGYHLWWLAGWMALVTSIYYFTGWKLMTFPWLPLSLIGTAVAFYVGFKNSHAYDRLWGAIQIWSSITKNSRQLATMVRNYRSDEAPADDATAIRRQMIFRHIAYLYQLREQLLEPMQWEHVSIERSWITGRCNHRRRAKINNLYKTELEEVANNNYLSAEERISLQAYRNKAAQILDIQAQVIQRLYESKIINMIQQIEIQGAINRINDDQANVERIKQIPFPRKYASFSFVFVCIFVFLLPFGIIGEFSKIGGAGIWLSIPVGAIVGWIYVAMEMIGDYSENPFEGLFNDAPMLSMCRAIEIDMLQTIGEKNIPRPIQPKGQVLL
jgi:putative membrane protein